MSSSPARTAANRKNALKSTGPKTEAGKAITRANAVKHGLTGAGLALPNENAADLKASFANYMLQMDPQTEAGKALVFKIAVCDLRIRRLVDVEKAMASQSMLDAGHAFDDQQYERREELINTLYQDPETSLRKLGRFEVGAEWVFDAWESLAVALANASWRADESYLFEALEGRRTSVSTAAPERVWNLAASGNVQSLASDQIQGETPADRAAYARAKLLEVVSEGVAEWTEILEEATAASAVARSNAVAMAAFDDSDRAILARKYEATATRELNKALKEYAAVEAAFAPEQPVVPDPEPAETCAELASILPAARPEPEDYDDETYEALRATLEREYAMLDEASRAELPPVVAQFLRR